MKRTKYNDGVEVGASDLNNTESKKIEEIKYRHEFVHKGAIGLLVTAGAGSTVDIAEGVGYCANDERIEYSGEVGVSVTAGQYNYVTLVYVEIENSPKPHEYTGDSYNTKVSEGYTVSVLLESAYNSLSVPEKENRVICGIVKDSDIQTGRDLSAIPTSSSIGMNGVWVGKYSDNTEYGKGYFQFDVSTKSFRYKAPDDTTWGGWVVVTENWLDSDKYKLESGNIIYWVNIEVLYPILPVEDEEVDVNVRDLYVAPLIGSKEVSYETSTGSIVDNQHRGIHLFGTSFEGGPLENNPHGIHGKDFTGFQTDVYRHQDQMHCNGIISRDWFLTGESNALQPTFNEETGVVTIGELGENYYHINGVVFEEVDETFPYTFSTPDTGLWFLCLGADKKFHAFKNTYDAKNYIPIARAQFQDTVIPPTLWVSRLIMNMQFQYNQPGLDGRTTEEWYIANAGTGIINYSIVDSSSVFISTPGSGSSTGESDKIGTKFYPSTLGYGWHYETITITAAGAANSPQVINVNINIVA
jgi:hypothetical protein